MYEVVKNSQYEVLATRNSYLSTSRIIKNPVTALGRFHSTRNFSVQPDGSVVITFTNDDTNDNFVVSILMVKMTFHIDISRQHWWYQTSYPEQNNFVASNSPAFIISIGDIFKHYYKYNMNAINSAKELKKKKKGEKNVEEEANKINEENEDAHINKLVLKSMKVIVNNTDVRAIIGSIETWKRHDMRLWDVLLDQGHLKTLGSDFTSFCNSFIVLPMYLFDPAEDLSACLAHISSHLLVKKLTKFFLIGEDPSAKGYVAPIREFFDAKSIVAVLEENTKDLVERFSQARFDKVVVQLTKELNNTNKAEIEEKYTPPQIFSDIQQVGPTYPLHALRTIFISSWCSNDFEVLEGLVISAKLIAKSDKSKHLIDKRGKFQKYGKYAADNTYRYESYTERNNKYDVVQRETTE